MRETESSKIPKHLKIAIRIAEANENYPKWSLGTVITKGGAVQSVGQSRLHTNPLHVDVPPHEEGRNASISTHAETDAMKRCGNPKGSVMFVARVGRDGEVRLARPCPSCIDSMTEAQVKRVYYTIDGKKCGVMVL